MCKHCVQRTERHIWFLHELSNFPHSLTISSDHQKANHIVHVYINMYDIHM